MSYGTRSYRFPVDDDLNPVPKKEATQILVSINEVIHPDGTESVLDEWTTCLGGFADRSRCECTHERCTYRPPPARHDPDPEMAKLDAGDAAYHERIER